MSRRKPSREDLESFCTEAGPEDGIDPLRMSQSTGRKKGGRKTLQLCSQVERALQGILAELADEVLQNLLVVSVQPAPNAMQMLVTVAPMVSAPETSSAVIHEHLQRASGRLRQEVAYAIHRRKAPDLFYQVQRNC